MYLVETKKGEKSSTDPFPESSEDGGKRLKMLLETGTELVQDFFNREDLSDEGLKNHQEDIEKVLNDRFQQLIVRSMIY